MMLGLGSSLIHGSGAASSDGSGSRLAPYLDDFSDDFSHAYSVHQLTNSYTGACLRVRRSSDNAEQDIGFTSSGDLNTASISSFCGGNNGFVSKWYGQDSSGGTGSGNDAVQSDPDQQPKIFNGTSVIEVNGKPSLDFDANTGWFATTASRLQPFSFFSVVNPKTVPGTGYVFSALNVPGLRLQDTAGGRYVFYGGGNLIHATTITTGQQIIDGHKSASVPFQSIRKNGVQIASSTTISNYSAPTDYPYIAVGNYRSPDGGGVRWRGQMQALILMDYAESSKDTIEGALDTYFGVT